MNSKAFYNSNMAYKLIIKTLAEQDLTQAAEWYAEQSPHLPEPLIRDFDITLSTLKDNPRIYQKRYGQVRIAFTQRFPYGIYFTIEEKTVYVHAILHAKQRPQTGLNRIKAE